MTTEESPGQSSTEIDRSSHSAGGAAGFVAGVLFGAFVGAGIAILFAPQRGDKTRGNLRRRIRALREDASEGLDRVGSRTRKELRRRQRRIRAELARARARAERAVE